jgi:hypothetical protein
MLKFLSNKIHIEKIPTYEPLGLDIYIFYEHAKINILNFRQ